VGIGYGACHHVLTKELGMHRVVAKFVPRILTADRPLPAVSGKIQNGCHPPPTILPSFGTLWLLTISENEIEAERMPVWYHLPLRRSRPNHRECLTLWQKRTSRKRSKNGGEGGTGACIHGSQ
jgi:hypothetical protein